MSFQVTLGNPDPMDHIISGTRLPNPYRETKFSRANAGPFQRKICSSCSADHDE